MSTHYVKVSPERSRVITAVTVEGTRATTFKRPHLSQSFCISVNINILLQDPSTFVEISCCSRVNQSPSITTPQSYLYAFDSSSAVVFLDVHVDLCVPDKAVRTTERKCNERINVVP